MHLLEYTYTVSRTKDTIARLYCASHFFCTRHIGRSAEIKIPFAPVEFLRTGLSNPPAISPLLPSQPLLWVCGRGPDKETPKMPGCFLLYRAVNFFILCLRALCCSFSRFAPPSPFPFFYTVLTQPARKGPQGNLSPKSTYNIFFGRPLQSPNRPCLLLPERQHFFIRICLGFVP